MAGLMVLGSAVKQLFMVCCAVAVCFGGYLGLSCSLRCNAEYCVEIGCLLLDSDIAFFEMGSAYKYAVTL